MNILNCFLSAPWRDPPSDQISENTKRKLKRVILYLNSIDLYSSASSRSTMIPEKMRMSDTTRF